MRWFLVLTLCLSGCDLFFDVDSVVFLPNVDMNPGDVADMTMEDMAQDSNLPDLPSPDMPDTPDLPMPELCEPGGLVLGNCDPVAQECLGDEGCVQFFSAAQETLINQCGNASTYVLDEGALCQPNERCKPGLLCRDTCKRMCERTTGRGCLTGEFCRTFEASYGFGYCDDSCG